MRNVTLMFMRHGKAAREGGAADYARRLEKRGRIEVASVAIREWSMSCNKINLALHGVDGRQVHGGR